LNWTVVQLCSLPTSIPRVSVLRAFAAPPTAPAPCTERQDILPAPYLARAQWVALQTREALRREELADLLRESYEMVLAKLSTKVRQAIAKGGSAMPEARILTTRKKKVASKETLGQKERRKRC